MRRQSFHIGILSQPFDVRRQLLPPLVGCRSWWYPATYAPEASPARRWLQDAGSNNCGRRYAEASASAQMEHKGGKWVSSSLKNEPVLSTFIVSPPVYSHTAFLDDFFWRSFPYPQVEATLFFRALAVHRSFTKDSTA